MSADMKSRFRGGAKVCSAAIMVLLVIGALGPARWTPRTALGWQMDHFLGYFAITLLVCLAWPRPLLVGGSLMATAFLLEGLNDPVKTPVDPPAGTRPPQGLPRPGAAAATQGRQAM